MEPMGNIANASTQSFAVGARKLEHRCPYVLKLKYRGSQHGSS